MSRDNQVRMPTSTAGLTRYFEDYKSRFEIKPGHVIVISVLIIIATLLLHQFGSGWLQ